MPSTYSNLKIQLMATGENNTTWGDVTNTNLGTAVEEALVGSADVTFASGNVTLTLTNTNASQTARNLRLRCTGTTGGATRNLVVPSINKSYIVRNDCADPILVKTAAGTGITVPAGRTTWVYSDSVNVVDAVTHLSSLSLGSALPVTSGGTGATSLTAGYVLKGNGTSAVSSSVIYDDGTNVGIGTASPKQPLTVVNGTTWYRPSGAVDQKYTDANDDGSNFDFRFVNDAYNSANTGIRMVRGTGHNVSSVIVYTGANTERMRIDANGNVGIGTNSPTFRFVAANNNFDGVWGGSSSTYSFLGFGGYFSGSAASAQIGYERSTGAFVFGNGTRDTPTERMRIDANGNVGIGITTPATPLDVASANSRARLDLSTTSPTWFVTNPAGSAFAVSIFNASQHVWQTSNTERMRIDASGNLLAGTTTNLSATTSHEFRTAAATVWPLTANGVDRGLLVRNSSATSGFYAYFEYNNGPNNNGSISYSGGTTSYNTTSDARIKENITDAEDAGELIDAIRVRSWDFKADGMHWRYGMVAQELIEVVPEAVSVPADEDMMMGVDYSKLVPLLVKEVQELRARVAELEGK